MDIMLKMLWIRYWKVVSFSSCNLNLPNRQRILSANHVYHWRLSHRLLENSCLCVCWVFPCLNFALYCSLLLPLFICLVWSLCVPSYFPSMITVGYELWVDVRRIRPGKEMHSFFVHNINHSFLTHLCPMSTQHLKHVVIVINLMSLWDKKYLIWCFGIFPG